MYMRYSAGLSGKIIIKDVAYMQLECSLYLQQGKWSKIICLKSFCGFFLFLCFVGLVFWGCLSLSGLSVKTTSKKPTKAEVRERPDCIEISYSSVVVYTVVYVYMM